MAQSSSSEYLLDVKPNAVCKDSKVVVLGMEPYCKRGSWSLWKYQFEIMVKLYKVKKEDHVNVLLRTVGKEVLLSLISWVKPKDPLIMNYQEVMTVLDMNLDLKEEALDRRLKFLRLEKKSNQTWLDYIGEHRYMLNNCDFDETAKDQIAVPSLLNSIKEIDLKRKLRDQNPKTIEEAYSITLRWDKLNPTSSVFDVPTIHAPTIHAVQQKKNQCYTCGAPDHKKPECAKRNEKCRRCNKIGHLEKMCRQKQINHVEEEAISDYYNYDYLN